MNQELFKKYGGFAIGAIIIIILLIIILTHHKPSSLATSATTPSQVGTAVTTATPVGGVSVVTQVTPQISFLGQTATSTTDTTTTKHGFFTIAFSVNAADKDIYISPTCQNTASSDGVSFTLVTNGVPSTDGIGAGSCLVSPATGVKTTASHRFIIPAYTTALFHVVVVAHPTISGTSFVQMNSVGYAVSDKAGNHTIKTPTGSKNVFKTDSVAL